LWRDSIWRMWRGTLDNGGLSIVGSADTIAYDNLLACESMEFDLDMGRDLWLNKQRWTRLVRQYLDPEEVTRFVEHATLLGRGEGAKGACTSMFCRTLRESLRSIAGVTACSDSSTTVTLEEVLQHSAMHSRVSYIAYIGGLDLALARVLAGYIGRRLGLRLRTSRFRWHVDALQFHGFKSIPMLFKNDFIEDLESEASARSTPPSSSSVSGTIRSSTSSENGIHGGTSTAR
jgi:hypothetical protein